MRLPAPQQQHEAVPVAVGRHLHVAAGCDDDAGEDQDDAESTVSDHSHLTLPLEEHVHVDAGDPWADDAVRAHYEVAAGSCSEEQSGSGSDNDSDSDDDGRSHRRHGGSGRRSPAAAAGAGVPALVVIGSAAAVMLLALVALVALKRRQRGSAGC